MLRYTLFPICFIYCFAKGFSQDLLITNDGDTLSISVVEINDKYLVYKNLDSGEGIIISKRNSLKKIIYSKGDVFLFKTGIRKK